MRSAWQSLWSEPRIPHAPGRVWRDWALVGVLMPVAVLEGIFRDDLPSAHEPGGEVGWRPVALVVCTLLVLTLLWRRTRPLEMLLVAFGVQTFLDVALLFGAGGSAVLYTTGFVLLFPYALARWGSGREIVIGLPVVVVCHVFRETVNSTGSDVIAGIPFLLLPAAIGGLIRYRTSYRLRELDQVKLREREQLARELHDTVGHHVSAIAIRAQAGRVLAETRPDAAVEALEVIEVEAARTLAEMRAMVSALRDSGDPDLSPQRGVADIEQLARTGGELPRVDVSLSGDLDDLRSSVGAAVYRLAQESVTNAVRHARHATRIDVRVTGDDDWVRLTVVDDGETGSTARSTSGFGLVGMTERANLLGGTLEAGPDQGRGWTVSAALPRAGTRT